MEKKGQLNLLAPAILALVFAAVVLVFGIVMSQELVDTRDATVTLSIANESLTAWEVSEDTNQTLAGASACGFGTVDTTSVVVYNTTGNILIAAGNYTAYSDGNMVNITDQGFDEYAWQVSYDYTWGDEACEAGNLTVYGLGQFADFWEIIVLAIVITVVIGLLLVVFGGRRIAR